VSPEFVSPEVLRWLADAGFSGVVGFAIGAVNAGVVALIRKAPKEGHA
jgi:predicted DNA repair protein MutK